MQQHPIDTTAQRRRVRHILVIEDSSGRRTVSLEAATYSLGRDPSSALVLHSNYVSRQHAILLRVPVPGEASHL
ncbi:MAG: FHA domain-containing protein, partial [Cyanobacteria bacterium P01_G01_bin.4]